MICKNASLNTLIRKEVPFEKNNFIVSSHQTSKPILLRVNSVNKMNLITEYIQEKQTLKNPPIAFLNSKTNKIEFRQNQHHFRVRTASSLLSLNSQDLNSLIRQKKTQEGRKLITNTTQKTFKLTNITITEYQPTQTNSQINKRIRTVENCFKKLRPMTFVDFRNRDNKENKCKNPNVIKTLIRTKKTSLSDFESNEIEKMELLKRTEDFKKSLKKLYCQTTPYFRKNNWDK